jgi:hypothetical protein
MLDTLLQSIALTVTVMFTCGFGLGYVLAFRKYYNPITREFKKAVKKDLALALIFHKDGVATFKSVKLEGDYLVDEKGNRMWEVKRMKIVSVKEGSDKPAILMLSNQRIPIYVLHEDNSNAPSNPQMILIDPDALISGISAKSLYQIKQRAELLGMLRERSKFRDAMYYFLIFLGIGIALYLIINAVSTAVKH